MKPHEKQPNCINLTAVIIAGGKGTRLGGKDKGLLEMNGKPLITHIIEQLSQQTDKILINANRNLEQYRQTGITVISDSLPEFPGPLAGMLAALDYANTEFIITVPCDSPIIPSNYTSLMYAALFDENAENEVNGETRHKADIAIAFDGKRKQQMYIIIPTRLADELRYFLLNGGRAIKHWLAEYRVIHVDFSGQPNAFRNINTLEDLATLKDEETNRHEHGSH